MSDVNKNTCAHDGLSWGLLALRIAIGVIFIQHGWGKLFGDAPGMEVFTGMVGRIGFFAPALFAYAAALSEFVGGIAVLLGIWTRWFSALIGIVMFVAFVFVKKFAFPAGDADFALLAIAITLTLTGPGMFSLARYFGKEKACLACETK
ncbi:MAG: DoxX family protein [Candidatus Uhrbacteria bacterium]|nr:DoxX family protein [Candidatus Uhrbacteria bacterium]